MKERKIEKLQKSANGTEKESQEYSILGERKEYSEYSNGIVLGQMQKRKQI